MKDFFVKSFFRGASLPSDSNVLKYLFTRLLTLPYRGRASCSLLARFILWDVQIDAEGIFR